MSTSPTQVAIPMIIGAAEIGMLRPHIFASLFRELCVHLVFATHLVKGSKGPRTLDFFA